MAVQSSARQDALKAALAVLILLIVAEIALRAAGVRFGASFFSPDPVLGFVMRPHAEGWYVEEGENYVRLNSEGFYDRERLLTKEPGTFRIAFLGSSYPEAIQVNSAGTVGAVLEKLLSQCPARLRKVEVLSFGVAGYTLAQSYLQLRTKVWAYHPDMILLGFDSISGVLDNTRETSVVGSQSPYYVLREGQLVFDKESHPALDYNARSARLHDWIADASNRIRLFSLVNYARIGLRDRLRARNAVHAPGLPADFATTFAYRPPEAISMDNAWKVNDALLLAFRQEAEKHVTPLWLVIQDTPQQTTPILEDRESFERRLGVSSLFYSNERIEAYARRIGIPTISLAQRLADYSATTHRSLHGVRGGFLNGGHWNEEGNAQAAKIIALELCTAISRSR